MCTYIPSLLDFPPSPSSHPSGSPQSAELSCARFVTGPHQLAVSHTVVYTRHFRLPAHPSSPLPPCVHSSLHLHRSSFPANILVCTIFLDFTYIHSCTIFVFLFLTSVCMTVCRSIHVSRSGPITFLLMAE